MTELQKLIEEKAIKLCHDGDSREECFAEGFNAADAIGFADFCMKNMYDSEFAILTTEELYLTYLKQKT